MFSRGLSAGMQTLMEEIAQNIRWFRDKGRSSALQVGKMKADAERIQVETDNTDVWHNNLTIRDIRQNVSEVSQKYGREGMERLSQLQKKIVEVSTFSQTIECSLTWLPVPPRGYCSRREGNQCQTHRARPKGEA